MNACGMGVAVCVGVGEGCGVGVAPGCVGVAEGAGVGLLVAAGSIACMVASTTVATCAFLGYEDGFLGRIQGVKNPGLGFVHQPCQLVVDTCGAEKQETRQAE